MLWSERFVRDHKRQTDCAIHNAYTQLAHDPLALNRFHELVRCVRQQGTRLLSAPVQDGRHLGICALVNLARFRSTHIRKPANWLGSSASWRPVIASLADHLVCTYTVPMFLSASWYATASLADEKRRWFVAHSRGASFRSLNLPVPITRKMEHIFLASPDHLPIEQALRRAELLALGVPREILKAIMSTPLATDLQHGEFWRTVWNFFVVNSDDIDPAQVAPMIDYIQAVRNERTHNGTVVFGPPQPAFSMKGRTVQSLQKLMRDWHRSLGMGSGVFSWPRSPFQPLILDEPLEEAAQTRRRWHMMELTTSAQLRSEGAALHHCVASYAHLCHRGISSIWSLRLCRNEKVRSVLTVEIDLKKRAVIQARGMANHRASGKPLRLLHEWAARERIQIAI